MNCRLCGSTNPDGAEVCAACGASLAPLPRAVTRWLFIGRLLPALDRGPLLQRVGEVVLQATAALLAVSGAYKWFTAWAEARHMDGAEVVGLIVFQVLTLVMFYGVVHAAWVRAGDVAALPPDRPVAFGIAAAWFKLAGECYAIVAACGGLATALLVLVSGPYELAHPLLSLYDLFPALPTRGENPVTAALATVVTYGIAAFAGLLAGHLAGQVALAAGAAAARLEGERRG